MQNKYKRIMVSIQTILTLITCFCLGKGDVSRAIATLLIYIMVQLHVIEETIKETNSGEKKQ